MKISIRREIAEIITISKLKPFGIDKSDLEIYGRIKINLAYHTVDKIKDLKNALQKVPDGRKTALLIRDIDMWISMCEKTEKPIVRLEHLESALIKHLLDVDGHRVYKKFYHDSEIWLPFRVTNVQFDEATAYSPAKVEMTMIYQKFGILQKTIVIFHAEDVIGKNVTDILNRKGVYVETKDLRQNYVKEEKIFKETFQKIGKQFRINGVGTDEILDKEENENGERESRTEIHKFNFIDNKGVVDVFLEDDDEDEEEKEIDIGELFWKDPFSDKKSYEDEEENTNEIIDGKVEETIEIPIHLFLTMFDLQRHLRLSVHVNYLSEYVYKKNLSEKLVLSQENKDLIQILIEHKEGGFKDIVENKTGGAVILLSGKSGVGKTLTAEVYAESKEKPLYNVQASQLGISPVRLEKQLMKVLRRAARWNAILLIDEADVYIHERGNDMVQNAIVGVILRILEYHSSILFMTTNRGDIVDDAIASRCVARIDYEYPTTEQQIKIWNILSESSNITLSEDLINKIVKKYDKLCGRDIKNLLKLANLKAQSEKKNIDLETIDFVTRFNPTIKQGMTN